MVLGPGLSSSFSFATKIYGGFRGVDIQEELPGSAVFVDYSLRVIVKAFFEFSQNFVAFSLLPSTFANKGHEIAATQVFYLVPFPQFSDPE
jgi:hypothetical protein